MTPKPDICILIPTYNHARYIAKCLESLLSQSLRPSRIKIFDDCSTDDTWDIVQGFVRREPGLFEAVRNKRNLGARGNGLQVWAAAGGEYCSFIEGDDYWGSDKLKGEFEALAAYPEAGAAYSNVAMINEHGKVTFIYHVPDDGPMPSGNIFCHVATRSIFPRTGNCFRNYLFRTKCFRSLEWRIEKEIPTMGDYDLHLRFTESYPFAASTIAVPMIFYRRHSCGVSQNIQNVRLAQMLIYEKYDASFKKLAPEQELACRLFQETMLSTMTTDFPANRHRFYSPGAVYERMLRRVAELPQETVNRVWRSSISLFRQLALHQVAGFLREGRDQEALATWLKHYRNETHPLDGWFSLSPEIFARLQTAHKDYMVSRRGGHVQRSK